MGLYLSLSVSECLDGCCHGTRETVPQGGMVSNMWRKTGTKRRSLSVIAQFDPNPTILPIKMPFNIRKVNKLQKWLLDRYAASALNVCAHQPLPKMSGPS